MGTGILVLLGTLGLGAPLSDVYTMRNRHLEIPIVVNDAKRAELKELELHVSTDQGRTWQLINRAEPTQQAFKFHAGSDGLYWFAVCAVDKAGSRDPADINQAPANRILKVLIDTATPVLRIVAADRIGDEVVVTWETQDIQADPASLQVEFRVVDAGPGAIWQRVPVNPALNGQTKFRPLTNGAITLRVQINDGTGTPATVLKDLPASLAATPIAAAPVVPVPQPMAIQQANSIAPPPTPAAPLGQMPTMTGSLPQPIPAADLPPPAPSATTQVAPPSVPTPVIPTPSEAPSGPAPLAARTGGDPTPRPPITGPVPDIGGSAQPPSRNTPPDVQHVRDRQVGVEFDIDRKGPSGVKRIQVFVTPDDGRSWFPYTETDQTTSPLQLTLPEEEGLFGFRLVLYSGADQSVGPPRSGDTPDIRLQVDRTKPKVTLYSPTIAPGQPNALVLHYGVSDAHLDPGTIRLYWSMQPQGQWQAIAAGSPRPSSIDPRLKECTWTLPPDLPDRVYLRLTASDLAGNEGEFITRDPVTVDLHKPTAKVKGVISLGPPRK